MKEKKRREKERKKKNLNRRNRVEAHTFNNVPLLN